MINKDEYSWLIQLYAVHLVILVKCMPHTDTANEEQPWNS